MTEKTAAEVERIVRKYATNSKIAVEMANDLGGLVMIAVVEATQYIEQSPQRTI